MEATIGDMFHRLISKFRSFHQSHRERIRRRSSRRWHKDLDGLLSTHQLPLRIQRDAGGPFQKYESRRRPSVENGTTRKSRYCSKSATSFRHGDMCIRGIKYLRT